MKFDDNTIVTFDVDALLSRDLLYSLLEINEPEERARIEALLDVRAKEIGIQQQFRKVVKAFHDTEKTLDQEFSRSRSKASIPIDLDMDATGKPVPSIDNFLKIIENDEKFHGLKFNLLNYSPEKEVDGHTERWTDADDAESRRYIEKTYRIHSQPKCDDAFKIAFAKYSYHPIRDIIDSFQWDGENRIEMFLNFAAGCEDTAYTREVSRLIFAGGINRLYNPGCKFDDMPVFVGAQGHGKSTLVRWLALRDEYFNEISEFDGQRGIEALEGAWICEVSELLAMTRTKEQEAVKSFLTRLNDRYRMPFDKRVTEHPRQCIFIGTTNKEQFLTDKTGNRRFYPVNIVQGGYDLFDREGEIRAYIRQCWAEAKARLMRGDMKPYARQDLISEIRLQQSRACEDDYRVGMIQDYLESNKDKEVCIIQLWREALGMGDFSSPSKKDSNEIGLIMQTMDGWVKTGKSKRFREYGVQKYWKKETGVEVQKQPIGVNFEPVEEDDDLPF